MVASKPPLAVSRTPAVVLSLLSLLPVACGGTKAGTQTGDEGDLPHSSGPTSNGSSASAGGASGNGSSATTGGGTSNGTNESSSTSQGGAASGTTRSGDQGGASATIGSGGAGGDAGSAGSALTSSSGGAGGSGGATSEECDPECALGLSCCDGVCVNFGNDIHNCGACGVTCSGDFPHCAGACTSAPCSENTSCEQAESCCGNECCGAGELCCLVNVGPTTLGCTEPVNGTCPVGCPGCDCAAPDTPIATPSGPRPIASLKVGDLVYSVDSFGTVVVPIVRVNRVSVANHRVMEVVLDDGTTLAISPRHPLAGEGVLGDLVHGAQLGDRTVLTVRSIPYRGSFTYDILPGSETGAYYAGGALIGSTLAAAR